MQATTAATSSSASILGRSGAECSTPRRPPGSGWGVVVVVLACAAAWLACNRDPAGQTWQDLATGRPPPDDLSSPPDLWHHLLDGSWPRCTAGSAPIALVDGVTPLGPFHGRHAYFAHADGDCNQGAVLLSTNVLPPPPAGGGGGDCPLFERDEGVRLQSMHWPPWPELTDCLATIGGTSVPCSWEFLQVAGDPLSGNPIELTVVASGGGWQLSGWLCAAHRHQADMVCPGPDAYYCP